MTLADISTGDAVAGGGVIAVVAIVSALIGVLGTKILSPTLKHLLDSSKQRFDNQAAENKQNMADRREDANATIDGLKQIIGFQQEQQERMEHVLLAAQADAQDCREHAEAMRTAIYFLDEDRKNWYSLAVAMGAKPSPLTKMPSIPERKETEFTAKTIKQSMEFIKATNQKYAQQIAERTTPEPGGVS